MGISDAIFIFPYFPKVPVGLPQYTGQSLSLYAIGFQLSISRYLGLKFWQFVRAGFSLVIHLLFKLNLS